MNVTRSPEKCCCEQREAIQHVDPPEEDGDDGHDADRAERDGEQDDERRRDEEVTVGAPWPALCTPVPGQHARTLRVLLCGTDVEICEENTSFDELEETLEKFA